MVIYPVGPQIVPLDEDQIAALYNLVAEAERERDALRTELEIAQTALADIGVTPAEARAGVERSRERQSEIERLRAERDALKNKLVAASHYIDALGGNSNGFRVDIPKYAAPKPGEGS